MKLKYALKRIVERTTQFSGLMGYHLKNKNYFDIKLENRENLPNEGGVLAFNHACGLDGILLGLGFFPNHIHQMIQYEGVYDKKPLVRAGLWALGYIPVSVGKLDQEGKIIEGSIDGAMNSRAVRRARDYLNTYRDFVGIFIDGPANRLTDQEGRPMDKIARPASESAAFVAITSDKPIIPIGIRMPEHIANRLWEFGFDKAKKNMEYLENRKQKLIHHGEDPLIPYQIIIGKPVYPKEISGYGSKRREIITNKIKEEIIRLSD